MKFSSKEDIEAPIAQVFDMLSEFEIYERSAIRRGIEVQRMDDFDESRIGMTWMARFDLRGRRRHVQVRLAELDHPTLIEFQSSSPGIQGQMSLELMALSPRRTRMSVVLEIKPKNLQARLLIQSLKLAKAKLTKRFKLRVAEFAKQMEDRHDNSREAVDRQKRPSSAG